MSIKTTFCAFFLCFSSYLTAQNIPYRNLFDDKLMPRIDILLPEDSLTWLYSHVNYDANIRANFIFFDGVQRDTMLNVGFRLRGNTSRASAKKSFKLKFNAYTKGIKYQGVKELNLNGQHNDPTMVREKLFYDLWNDFGMPPRRTSFSKVYINNRYFGLYTSLEEMDDEWLKKAFGKDNDTGNLYKCTYPADLKYISDNQTSYKNLVANTASAGRVYDLKTNELADDYSDLVTLIKKGNQSTTATIQTELSKILDVNLFLKAYALEVMTGHWDDYGYNKNNYFLYHNPLTNLFEFITYDTDNTFGVDWLGKDWGNRAIYTWHLPANGILIENILKVPFYKNLYSTHLRTLLETTMALPKMHAKIDSLRNFIRQAATDDTYRAKDYAFTMQQFNDNFDYTPIKQAKYGLKGFLQSMRTTAYNQLVVTKTDPSVSNDDFVKIYPNPVVNQFFIELDKTNFRHYQLQLLDIKGDVLQTIEPKSDKITVNTEGLVKGVYFVKIQLGQKISFRKLLINN
jgi:CotH kinase protein/Secretion system C-terminal sorting domain